MTREKIASLIQVNNENFWKKMAETKLVSIHDTGAAVYMDSGFPDPIFNSVIRFAPKEENFDAEFNKIHQYYTSKDYPYCWWTIASPNGITPLEQRVFAEGFMQILEVKGMAMNIESFQWDGFMPEGKVVQLSTPKHLSDWMKPIQASFDMAPDILKLYYNIMTQWLKTSSDEVISYVMYFNGHPVSSFTVFFDKEVASFYNVATIPAFRKKRIPSAIAACCLAMAQQRKYKWATLQASPYSVKLFERLGFRTYIDYVLRFK